MTLTALAEAVELNENAKALRKYAFEVSLSALGAIVRSCRAGDTLRGFNEVAEQMRRWSRDLEGAAQQLYALAVENVRLESSYVRKTRLVALLARAGAGALQTAPIVHCVEHEERALAQLRTQLRHIFEQRDDVVAAIGQLGLMASVLSRAALIEAASGLAHQRRELSVASHEFASYAERVNQAVSMVAARSKAGAR